MLVKEIMQIGEKIDVVVQSILAGTSNVYYSMVQDIPADEELLITVPMSGSRPVALRKGQNVKINFYRDRGQFYFYAEVIERFKSGTMRLIRLKQTSQIFRLQRRDYFRLKANIPVLYRIIKHDNAGDEDAETYKGLIADISGGGIGLLTDEKLKLGTRIETAVSVQDELDVIVQGIVVRIAGASESLNTEYKYHAGIQFDKMDEDVRHEIIQYVIEAQRKQIRKEKYED